jgi:RAD51-like protein 1
LKTFVFPFSPITKVHFPSQATRQLSRLNLESDVALRLAAHKFFTVKDLYSRTLLDLVEVLDLPYETVQSLLQHVANKVVPQPVTALDLLKKSSEAPSYLRTLLPPLDTALLGGLPAGSICEVVGPAGLGKTQFCLGMCIVGCLDRIKDQGRVLFIDTERKFSGERLAQIARERFPESFSMPNTVNSMMDRVIVKSPESSNKLLELLENLESAIIDHSIKLIIIDSIASLARADFGAKDVMERQKLLGQQASRLKYLAESFRIPVLVTNQVTTVIGSGGNVNGGAGGNSTTFLTAALGSMWAHAVNTRLVMAAQQDPTTAHQLRVMTIAKSPAAPNISLAYKVTVKGVEWEKGVTPPPPQPGSVLDMVIANYQAYESEGGAAAFGR